MNTISAVVLGMVIWMTIVTLVDLITHEKEDIVIPVAAGIWAIVAAILCRGIYALRKLYAQKHYVYYQMFGKVDEAKNYINGWTTNYYMDAKAAACFKRIIEKDGIPVSYSIRVLRSGKEIKTVPQKSEILTVAKIKSGNISGFTSDYLEKFIKD